MCSSSQSKPAAAARRAARGELRRARGPCRRASWLARRRPVGPERHRPTARASPTPLAGGSGTSSPSHGWRTEPFRPACASWRPIFAGVVRVDEVDDPPPGRLLLAVPEPGAAGVIRPSGKTSVISAMTSAAPPRRAAAEVDEVPVVGHAVDRRVLAHRRDDDAVRELDRRERANGVKSGGGGAVRPSDARRDARRPLRVWKARSTAATSAGSRCAQVVVGDPLRARHQVERERHRLLAAVARRSPRTISREPSPRAGA